MNDTSPLQPGHRVPHFELRDVDGRPVRYADTWQRRNLVFVSLPENQGGEYVAELRARAPAFDELECTWVAAHEPLPGLAAPGLLVADRWGEIVHIATPPSVRDLPPANLLLQWLEAIEHRCPECEGEAR